MARNLDELATCTRCALSTSRQRVVIGSGPDHPRLMVIGEAPGRAEDEGGAPFIGRSGQLLFGLLEEEVGLRREQCFVTNVVKCRPPENRDPLPGEISACNDYLDRQIATLKPQVIVTLGRISMAKFFGGEKISAIHGRPRKFDSYICVPMFHPAAALRTESYKVALREDFKKIPLVLAEAARLAEEPSTRATATATKTKNSQPPEQMSLF